MATDTKMTPAAKRWLGSNFVQAPHILYFSPWFLVPRKPILQHDRRLHHQNTGVRRNVVLGLPVEQGKISVPGNHAVPIAN
jgi:hypothetical protein